MTAAATSSPVPNGRHPVDPAITARLLFGLVNSLIEWYRPHGGVTGRQLADTVVAVAFDGLRVR